MGEAAGHSFARADRVVIHCDRRAGMMRFAVLLAGAVNQTGATTPGPVPPGAGRGEVGVMTRATTHRPSWERVMTRRRAVSASWTGPAGSRIRPGFAGRR